MKKINIYYILALLFAISFASCEDTNENLVKNRGVAVIPEVSDIGPAYYTLDYDNSFIKFDVDLPKGQEVDNAEIQVTFKDKTAVVEEITTFPSTIKMTAADVISKLGLSASDVKLDDSFMFDVITTSGGVSSRSLSGALKVFVTCEFDPELAVGSYKAVSKDWEVEGNVTLTADPEDPFKISIAGLYAMEGGDANDNVLVLNIDPNSYKVSGAKAILGPSDPYGIGYTNFYYEPVGGLYKSCDGVFEMQIRIGIDQGSWGVMSFVFTPNDPA